MAVSIPFTMTFFKLYEHRGRFELLGGELSSTRDGERPGQRTRPSGTPHQMGLSNPENKMEKLDGVVSCGLPPHLSKQKVFVSFCKKIYFYFEITADS